MKPGVVITGYGVLCALGDRASDIHQALCEGRSGLSEGTVIAAEVTGGRLVGEVRDFDPKKYLGEKNSRPLDRTGRFAAVAVGLALADSGGGTAGTPEQPAGLVVGTMFSGVRTIGEFDRRAQSAGPEYASPLDFSNTVLNAAAGQVAIWHKLSGVNSTIAAGAASGLRAVGYATELIRDGRASVLIAGGVEELCFESFQGFLGAGRLCGPGQAATSLPFATGRSGVSLAEGGAFLVLEAEEGARARGAKILGRVQGFSSGFDPMPRSEPSDADGLAAAIARALDEAGVASGSLAAVAASASGSPAEDAREALGLRAAVGNGVPVTAIKSMTGEALGASGPLSAIVLLESLRTGRLPGVTGLVERDPDVDLNVRTSVTAISGASGLVTAVTPEGDCAALVIGVA
jgi:3-oxoacyl-[acyl-carrier-protein] synthase II